MPEIDWGQHLLDSLFEFGPVSHGMNGPKPVSYQEIEAWARITNTDLPGYEAIQLHTLSVDYCAQHHKAVEPNCAPPGEEPESRRARVSRQLAEFCRG